MNAIVQAAQERAVALYDNYMMMLQMVDQEGKAIVAVSEQWLVTLGYRRNEVLGQTATAFLSEASRAIMEKSVLPLIVQTGYLQGIPCELQKKDGTTLPVLLSVMLERNDQGQALRWFMVLNDNVHQPQAEKLLTEIVRNFSAADDDFFQGLVSHIANLLQARNVFVTECVNRTLTRVRTLAFIQGRDFVENIEYDVTGTPCAGVIGGALCYYPEQLNALFPVGDALVSYLGAPCYDSQGQILGHLAVVNDKPLHCAAEDLTILELFAARAGAELERKQAVERQRSPQVELQQLNQQLAAYSRELAQQVADRTQELERRRQVAEGLRDLLTILNSNRPLQEMLDYIVKTATQLLGTSSGAIYALQPNGKTLVAQATCGLPPAYTANLTFAADKSFLGQAIVKRQPVVVSNIAATLAEQPDSLDEQRQALLTQHYHTLLTVPLLREGKQQAGDKLYGAIALYYALPRPFSDEEIALVVAFAAQAALAIENAQLRHHVEQTAIMTERSRLARELHDSVTQSLYSMTLLSEGWRRMAVRGELVQVDERLAELGELSRQALKEMRLLVHELLPPTLEKEGLLGALYQRMAAVEKRAGIDARLVVDEVLDLPTRVEAALYRIAQEALNNALKHAAATAVTVTLRREGDQLILEISDNGKGFIVADVAAQGGLGMNTMRERAEQVGGTLTIHATPGQGATVRVQVALPTPERNH